MSETNAKGFTIGEEGNRHELTVMSFEHGLVVDTAFMKDPPGVRVCIYRLDGQFQVFIHRDDQEVAQVLLPDDLRRSMTVHLDEGVPAPQAIVVKPIPLMVIEGELA